MGYFWQQKITAQADFDIVLRRLQHGVASDFRAGSGGGGDGDERDRGVRQRLSAADHFQVIERVAGIGEHGGERLAGVERAAAAHGDDHVATLAPGIFGAAADQIHGGLAGHRER